MGGVAKRRAAPKRVLRLLDLEHSKRTLLSMLGSPDSKRAYEFAIDHFVAWYCSEPRLAFNKTVVLRYRLWVVASNYRPSMSMALIAWPLLTAVPAFVAAMVAAEALIRWRRRS